MKRLLFPIAAVAIVAGALAFKTQPKTLQNVYCEIGGTITETCPNNVFIKDDALGSTTDPCPALMTDARYSAHKQVGTQCVPDAGPWKSSL